MANNQIALMAKAPVFDTPFESQGKALQLRNAMNQSQAADMEMQQKRQAAQEMEVQRNALMSDPTGGDGYINALATGGAPTAYFSAKKAGLDAQKTTADINKTKAESDKSRFDIANKRFDAIGQSIGSLTQIPGGATPQHVTSAVQRLVDIGVIDPEMASSITASVPQDPAQMQEWLAQGQAAIMDGKSQLSFTTPDANAVLSAKTSRANNAATVGATIHGQNLTDARGREANDIAREKSESVGTRPLAAPVLKQLTEVRDNATTINNLATTFKPEFAGKGVFGMGADLQMDASARMGADKNAVEWWKNYKKQAELVERHAMFGASLTPGEQNSWRSADISPGMNSAVIERNLATRKALTQKMFENSTQDFIDAGHNAERITKIAGRSEVTKPQQTTDNTGMPSAKQVMINGTKAQAQLAPDGHYYIKQANGKYARVN